jgi:hypothetical protein
MLFAKWLATIWTTMGGLPPLWPITWTSRRTTEEENEWRGEAAEGRFASDVLSLGW